MSLTLITDGWLAPIITIPSLRAPDGTDAVGGTAPVVPGAPTASDLAVTPPAIPIQAQATGPTVPVTPCGITGSDPTLSPPSVPQAPEASEDLGDETPGVPRCPEGTKS